MNLYYIRRIYGTQILFYDFFVQTWDDSLELCVAPFAINYSVVEQIARRTPGAEIFIHAIV